MPIINHLLCLNTGTLASANPQIISMLAIDLRVNARRSIRNCLYISKLKNNSLNAIPAKSQNNVNQSSFGSDTLIIPVESCVHLKSRHEF